MEHVKKATDFILKYRYVLLVLAVGVVLMLLPSGTKEDANTATQETASQESINTHLEQILAQISGVGKVRVLVTVEAGEQTFYQSDDGDTVIITDADRTQSGLVQQILPQTYLGAIIVCQGADSAAVRLSVIDAVSKVTGLSTDRITVLKMK